MILSKSLFLVIFILVFITTPIHAALESPYKGQILKIIDVFRSHDKARIAELIEYPYVQNYPVPDIRDKIEFMARFGEIIDPKTVDLIASSNIDSEWSLDEENSLPLGDSIYHVDLLSGNSLDLIVRPNGTLMGFSQTAVGLETEKYYKEILKQSLHESIQAFDTAIMECSTKLFQIRIDSMSSPSENCYRYVAWTKNKSTRDEPDSVINTGSFTKTEGPFPLNGYYTFKLGKYTYQISSGFYVFDSENTETAMLNGSYRILKEKTIIDHDILSNRIDRHYFPNY